MTMIRVDSKTRHRLNVEKAIGNYTSHDELIVAMLDAWQKGKGEMSNNVLDTCPECGNTAVESETTGHTNSHGEPNRQVTVVMYYCAVCGAVMGQEVFDTAEPE